MSDRSGEATHLRFTIGPVSTIAPKRLVTLREMAALVNRTKKTLEKLKSRASNPLPKPDIPGGRGRPDEWLWDRVRPWLQEQFKRNLPRELPRRDLS
jgi:hypothetical protein